ncbi:MAG: NAD-dependent epimerase/dehydratase family protein [Solirubrobacterales bacterium]|nr:NAD-dependent epimerase/dehydratase family protein [Solirubrobacterales bacterium]
MRVLVTGGAGFIGSNITDALVARGDEVVVIDNLSSGREANLADALGNGATLRVADIRDADALSQIFAEARPEQVFHLAAQVDVRKSIADPAYDAAVNIVGTINVVEAARTVGTTRLVNTSTGGGIYGDVDLIPTPESVAPKPLAAYGQSKQCAEQYCAWARRLYGIETVTVRYGNVYGPRQDPAGEAGVIAIFCGRAVTGETPTIFGDGTQTRDYIYVGDIVAANLLAAEHPDAHGEYNIGTQVESSLLEVVHAVRQALPDGTPFEPVFAEPRLGEVQRSALDATRAREELGFVAQTALADGIRQTYAATAATLA